MKIYLLLSILVLIYTCIAQAEKIAIIKADDVRDNTEKWNRFFKISKEKEVKVSAGIICDSLEKGKPAYIDWLKQLQASGDVEFWNHGWDHKRWNAKGGKELKEFSGTDYAYQKKHFDDSQALMKKVLGATPSSFGAPYNAMDDNTQKVLAEDAALRLVFCNVSQTVKNMLLAPMNLRGEHDGTAKPNFEKFKADYAQKKNLTFSAIQFHPGNFSDEHFKEYSKILDLLIADGWKFVLPSEYIAMQAKP